MPAHREDRVRLWQSFRDSYQDKAVAMSLKRFYEHRRRETRRKAQAATPDDLKPIAGYFSRRYGQRFLKRDEAIVRTEVWVGRAAIGRRIADTQQAAAYRLANLRGYYDGPVENRLGPAAPAPYRASEEDGDMRWILEYFEGK